MTKAEREAARRRCELASPGPWVFDAKSSVPRVRNRDGDDIFWEDGVSSGTQAKGNDDLPFAAAARADLPAALADVDRLLVALKDLLYIGDDPRVPDARTRWETARRVVAELDGEPTL